MGRLGCACALVALLAPDAASAQCADEALGEAAAALLLGGGAPAPEALLDAVHSVGSDAPTAHALRVDVDDAARVDGWLDELRGRVRAPVRCGEARTAEQRLVVAVPDAGHLADVAPGRLRVTLAPGWDAPALFVEDARGHVVRLEPEEGIVTLPVDLEEPLSMQLVARGPDGPRPVAERRGSAPRPASWSAFGGPVERRIAMLRDHDGASSLRDHRVLAGVAQAHAEAVCRLRRAAHEVESGRDPRARLAERHIEARHVGEVVARGEGVDAAFDALVRSPSHRGALVDRRFTDVGHGLATGDDGRTCLVVLLAAWPRLVVGAR